MNRFSRIFGLFLGLFSLFLGSVSAAAPSVYTGESSAGSAISAQISGLLDGENFDVILSRPDREPLDFSGTADDFGRAKLEILGLHLQKSGNYALQIFPEISPETARENFWVAPGAVSAFASEILMEKSAVAADGENEARFQIQLKDAYQNPVADAKVQVFSSRNADQVLAPKTSDDRGIVAGKIFSKTPGISTLSVLADSTLLFEKPQIVFHWEGEENEFENVGSSGSLGDFLKAQLFSDSEIAEVAYFELSTDQNEEIVVDKSATVRVVAKDENNQTVSNYFGTVRFSSSDDRAELPADYQFTAEDQGEHTFFLAVNFATPGAQTLAVHDLNDFRISGEKSVDVALSAGATPVAAPSAGITITTPKPGSLRANRVTITGTSPECPVLKIVDGPTVLAEEVNVDGTQNFVFQTPTLANGQHEFQVICASDTSLTSESVKITIDRTPPNALLVELVPAGAKNPGERFQIKVQSNEPLSEAKCVLNGVLTELEPNGEAFLGSFTAPQKCGDHQIGCNISDLLGNKLEEKKAATLSVRCDADPTATPPNAENPAPAADPISSVNNNIAPTTPLLSDSQAGEDKVTLFWTAAKDDAGISHYRVVFWPTGQVGAKKENIVPAARTQWYIDEIESCQNYQFQVSAIDAQGNESPPSNQITAMTACDSLTYSSAPTTSQSGPSSPVPFNSFWITAGAFVLGLFIIAFGRRRA